MHKEYQVAINRTYTTYITLKFPDDNRNHMDIISEKINEGDQGIWDLIAEKELEQMEISNEDWEISEIIKAKPLLYSELNKIK